MFYIQQDRFKVYARILIWIATIFFYIRGESLSIIYCVGAIEIFYIIIQLTIEDVPDIMYRLSKHRIKRGLYKDAEGIKSAAFLYLITMGTIGVCTLSILSKYFVSTKHLVYTSNFMKLLCIAIIVFTLLNYIRGLVVIKASRLILGISYIVQVVIALIYINIKYLPKVSYANKLITLLQQEHIVYFYAGLVVVEAIIWSAICVAVLLGGLLIFNRFTVGHSTKMNLIDKSETLAQQVVLIAKTVFLNSFPKAIIHIPFIVIYFWGIDQVLVGNKLMGHFFGLVLPIILCMSDIDNLSFIKIETLFKKEVAMREIKKIKSLTRFIMVRSFYGTIITTVLYIVSIPCILKLVELNQDVAISKLAYASASFILFIMPVKYLGMVLSVQKRGVYVVIAGGLSTVVLMAGCFFIYARNAFTYSLIIKTVTLFMGIYTVLLLFIIMEIYRIKKQILTNAIILMLLVGGIIGIILYWITYLFLPVIGAIAVIVAQIVLAYPIYLTMIIFTNIFSKRDMELLGCKKLNNMILGIMGRKV